MRPVSLITLLALAAVAACGGPPAATYPSAATVRPAKAAEPLGVGDVFELTIYHGSQETKDSLKLGPQGTVMVRQIGEVKALGKKPTELQEEVRTRLADGYLRDPIVQVALVEASSTKISLFGQIKSPTTIAYVEGMTIVDAVAQAGGFSPMAKKNDVQVTRTVEGDQKTFSVPVDAIGEGTRPNFLMAPGDVVFVPERLF